MSNDSQLSVKWQKAEVVGKILAGLLVPLVILIAGGWLSYQQEKTADKLRNSDRVAQLLEYLASDLSRERILAVQVLRYHQATHNLPKELVGSLVTVAATDDVEVAALATAALGPEWTAEIERHRLLSELLAPMMLHLDRTKDYFQVWSAKNTVLATKVIHDSNKAVRTLLTSKAELIPPDLVDDAIELVVHYDAWFAEYERVQRERDTPYVFVGPKGKPFPTKSEARFRKRYEELVSATAWPTGN